MESDVAALSAGARVRASTSSSPLPQRRAERSEKREEHRTRMRAPFAASQKSPRTHNQRRQQRRVALVRRHPHASSFTCRQVLFLPFPSLTHAHTARQGPRCDEPQTTPTCLHRTTRATEVREGAHAHMAHDNANGALYSAAPASGQGGEMVEGDEREGGGDGARR